MVHATGANALASVPVGGHAKPHNEKAVGLTTSKAIEEMHGDEISRRLAMFAQSAPTGMYSKPRGRWVALYRAVFCRDQSYVLPGWFMLCWPGGCCTSGWARLGQEAGTHPPAAAAVANSERSTVLPCFLRLMHVAPACACVASSCWLALAQPTLHSGATGLLKALLVLSRPAGPKSLSARYDVIVRLPVDQLVICTRAVVQLHGCQHGLVAV